MKKTLKKLAVLLTAMAVLCVCLAFTACGDKKGGGEGGVTSDTTVKTQWKEYTYNYKDSANEDKTLEYALYTPVAYTEGVKLPLITYIPDASYVGSSFTLLYKSACIINWVTDEKMSEYPAFVLLPRFTETANTPDEGTQGGQVVKIIDKLIDEYGIDESRLYLTGQSMGGIFDFCLNDAYPEKFAATVYVGCQPGPDVSTEEAPDEVYDANIERAAFANQKWVYIASRLDQKAPYGQDDVQAKLDELGSDYNLLYGLDHTDTAALNAIVQAELGKDGERFFLGYTQLTSNGDGVSEHMQSFKYAYKIDAIFEWLMVQHL